MQRLQIAQKFYLRQRSKRRRTRIMPGRIRLEPLPVKTLLSILADFVIDFVRPGVDSSAQIRNLAEAMLLEVFDSFHTPRTHLANSNDLLARVQLVQTL